jgi:glycosyltransferase involved in cell wall biosynthesis
MTCDAVTAGSHYLSEYACRLNSKTYLLPTSVDTELFHPKNKRPYDRGQTTIGWLGSGDNYQLRYLKILSRPLDLISRKYDIELRLISGFSHAVKREFRNQGYKVDFGFDRWVPIQEVAAVVNEFDIGVMPLTDSPWERGKCSMKALEYMACGLPVVASPVGENNFVITNGFNGFLAGSESEWVDHLETLISDKEFMTKMGARGRKFVEETYSLPVITKNLINIIEALQ